MHAGGSEFQGKRYLVRAQRKIGNFRALFFAVRVGYFHGFAVIFQHHAHVFIYLPAAKQHFHGAVLVRFHVRFGKLNPRYLHVVFDERFGNQRRIHHRSLCRKRADGGKRVSVRFQSVGNQHYFRTFGMPEQIFRVFQRAFDVRRARIGQLRRLVHIVNIVYFIRERHGVILRKAEGYHAHLVAVVSAVGKHRPHKFVAARLRPFLGIGNVYQQQYFVFFVRFHVAELNTAQHADAKHHHAKMRYDGYDAVPRSSVTLRKAEIRN